MLAWTSIASRRLLLLAAAAMACGPKVDLETTTDDVATAGTTDEPGETQDSTPTVATTDADTSGGPMPTVREVDIIFMIDNSGSMGEEQAKLAAAIGNLVGVLDAASPPVDYRIAVTTSDNGNPWCAGTGPEAGSFVSTSCLQRLQDFVFQGAQTIDASQEACIDVCPLEELGLDVPWVDVESTTGSTNVPGGTVIDALRCMLPQGINGCGFEQQLESVWKAVRRTETEGDIAFGFHREGALLAIAMITDEVDCSYNADYESIFLPDGNRVFWSDPTAPAPTSAVCWNAGVVCTGAGTYDCFSQDHDVDGNVASDPDQDAVLRPLSRYTDYLGELGAYVFAIDGVAADGTPVYQDSLSDPQFQSDFGIGPGCDSVAGLAVPPVRIHELIEALSGPGNEHSICNSGFEVAMDAFANGIVDRLP